MEIYFLTTIHESKSDLQTQQEPDFLHLSAKYHFKICKTDSEWTDSCSNDITT